MEYVGRGNVTCNALVIALLCLSSSTSPCCTCKNEHDTMSNNLLGMFLLYDQMSVLIFILDVHFWRSLVMISLIYFDTVII